MAEQAGGVTAMFKESNAFSGFSVDDVEKARAFYADTLGLDVTVLDESMGLLQLDLAGGGRVLAYAKGEAHVPATFTILNFPVADVEAAVDALDRPRASTSSGTTASTRTSRGSRGARARRSPGSSDPAGNILSVLEDQ